MTTGKLMNLLILTVLLCAALSALPAFADNEPTTGTLVIPYNGRMDISQEYVYVTGEKEPGVLMKALDQAVSATITGKAKPVQEDSTTDEKKDTDNHLGFIDAVYGGVDAEAKGSNGRAVLTAGGIRGGFGVLTSIYNGGKFTGKVDSISASEDTALEVLLGNSGFLDFTARKSISSLADGVTVETGIDFEDPENRKFDDFPIAPPKDPGEGDWDDIPDEAEAIQTAETEKYLTDSEPKSTAQKNMPEFAAGSAADALPPAAAEQKSGSETESGTIVSITAGSIDAGGTAVYFSLNDDSMVTLLSEDSIISDGTAVQIDLTGKDGSVDLTSPIIDADEQGLVINAPAGSIDVTAEDSISAKSAVEVYNDGAKINLDAGRIFGGSGLFIESTSGAVIEKTKDIAIENYGIYVRTHKYLTEQDSGLPGITPNNSTSKDDSQNPAISVTVEGDVTDAYVFPETESEPIELPDPSEPEMTAKAGADGSENENVIASTGIIVEAETAGTTEIMVNGEVYTSYGNEIDAANEAEVNVSIRDDVTTSYGNRLSADNKAKVNFSVGNNINAGGKALDTLASDNGTLEISIGNSILVRESSADDEEETAGIYANSTGNGSTKINVEGSILVLPDSGKTGYGIYTDNTGGEITVSVGDGVIADGTGSVGAKIINDSDSSYNDTDEGKTPEIKTTIEINGDISGKSTGLYVDGSGSSLADIYVEGTILGDDAGVEISDEVAPKNLDLKVWKIVLKDGKAVTGGTQAAEVENNIKYLIKYAPDDLKDRVEVFDADGNPLPVTHGYQYAKTGETVYFRVTQGEVEGIYNGIVSKEPLLKQQDGIFSLRIPAGGGVWISSGPAPEPEAPSSHMDFYLIGDLNWLYGRTLPHTGFSASHVTPLAVRPQDLNYRRTGLTLQIPSLDVAEEIVTVPQKDGTYPVEWLGRSVGFLEESRLPGAGITVLTGHNHLNTMETGPFLFIKSLEDGDVLMVTKKDGSLLRYTVYGNYKIAADDFASVAGELRQNSLVLITCEDEAPDGGYINRRVVLADPAG